MFPQLGRFTSLGLLLLRLMVALVFITSGFNHLKDPEANLLIAFTDGGQYVLLK